RRLPNAEHVTSYYTTTFKSSTVQNVFELAGVWPWDPERVLYKLTRPRRVSTPEEMSYLFQASETPTPTTPRSFVAYAGKTQELCNYTEHILSNRAARLARASVVLGLNYDLATRELAKTKIAARERAQRQDNSRLTIQKGGVVTARGSREAVFQKAKIAEQKAVREAVRETRRRLRDATQQPTPASAEASTPSQQAPVMHLIHWKIPLNQWL
ncbi:hypothetical protein Alg215_11811, partial [Pyrenophora tritici-repentis]